jgi:hypothetical protein
MHYVTLCSINAPKHLNAPFNRRVSLIRRLAQSVEATGGVYKGKGRNRHRIMICTY